MTASGTPVGEALATMGSVQVIPVQQVLYQPSGNLQKIVEASPILQQLNEAIKTARLTWMLSGKNFVLHKLLNNILYNKTDILKTFYVLRSFTFACLESFLSFCELKTLHIH